MVIEDNEIKFTIDDGNFLEVLLLRARGETIKFASKQKKLEHEHEKRLKMEISILESNLHSDVNDLLSDKKKNLKT